jgi:hypothetical protein
MTAEQKFTSQDDAEIRSPIARWASAVREEDRAAIRESHSASEASAAARHASTSELLAAARRRATIWGSIAACRYGQSTLRRELRRGE